MELNEKLRKDVEDGRGRAVWNERRRSTRTRDALKYVAYRSRGYANRRLTRFAREAIVGFGLAAAASPRLAALSLALWLVQLGLGVMTESLSLAVRGTLTEHRRMKDNSFGLIAFALATSAFAALAWLARADLAAEGVVLTLFLLRAVVAIGELVLSAMTIEINAKRRVYVPPLWAYGLVLATAIGVGLASLLPSIAAAITISAVHASLKLLDQASSFVRARRAERERGALERSALGELVIPEAEKDRGWMREDTRRVGLVLGSYTTLVMLIFIAWHAGIDESGVLLVWSTFALVLAVGRRPFMAYAVDIVDFVKTHQWTVAVRGLNSATRVSLIFLAATGAAIAAFSHRFEMLRLPSLILAFAWVAALTQLTLMYAILTNSESRVLKAHSRLRGLALLAILGAELAGLKLRVHFSIALGFEIALLLIAVSRLRSMTLPRWLEHRFVEEFEKVGGQRRKHLPENFLFAWKVLSLQLKRHDLHSQFFLLKLRKPVAADRPMHDLLDRLERKFRSYDLMMALDPQHILVWLPLSRSEDLNVIRDRFLVNIPLHLDSLTPVSESTAFARIAPPTVATNALLPPTRLWSLDAGLVWRDEDGALAPTELEAELDRLARLGSVRVFAGGCPGARVDGTTVRLRALRSIDGRQQIAEFNEIDGSSEGAAHQWCERQRAENVGNFLRVASDRVPIVGALRGFQVASLVRGIAGRLGWKVLLVSDNTPTPKGLIRALEVEIGISDKHVLCIGAKDDENSERSQTLAA